MGILNTLKSIISSPDKKEFKEQFKEAERQMKIQKTLEERQKSANRRELERYYQEKEEKDIKEALDKIRKQKSKEAWSGKNSLINQKMDILKEDRPILKEKNIFKGHKQGILNGGNMYFR